MPLSLFGWRHVGAACGKAGNGVSVDAPCHGDSVIMDVMSKASDTKTETETGIEGNVEGGGRRRFLKVFGVSSAGVALAGAAAASKAKIKEGGDEAKAEIARLNKAYEELDRRSQLILKVVLVLSGLDIFLAL